MPTLEPIDFSILIGAGAVAMFLLGLFCHIAREKRLAVQELQEELRRSRRRVTDLSQVTSGIVLGVENYKSTLPEVIREEVNGQIREVTESYGIEDMVGPVVRGVKVRKTLLGDLEDYLPET